MVKYLKGAKDEMVKFSSPDAESVKSVLIDKHKKHGKKWLFVGLGFFALTLIYGGIGWFVHGYYKPSMFCADFFFSTLVLLTCFCVFVCAFVTYRPILRRELKVNGNYDITLLCQGVKVKFASGVELTVPKDKIDGVVEYDDYFVISCFNNKDEIVCEKVKLIEGDLLEFFDFIKQEYGISEVQKKMHGSYSKFLALKRKRRPLLSVIFALGAVALAFPCMWLSLTVIVNYLPTVMNQIMGILSSLELYLQLILGLFLLPFAIILAIITSLSSIAICLLPVFFLVLSFGYVITQIKKGWTWQVAVGLAVNLLSVAGVVLLILQAFIFL